MRWYRQSLWIVAILVTVAGLVKAEPSAGPTPKAPPPAAAPTADEAPPLGDDPRTLVQSGDELRESDPTAARALYERAVDKAELARYLKYGKTLREGRVLELMGDNAGAEARYRENAERDILYTILFLRIESRLPTRDALVDDLLGRVRAMAQRAKAGDDKVVLYVTSKGEPRYLEHVPDDQVLPRLRRVAAGDDDAKLRYCYIDNVDLTGVDPATLPHRMQFSQCVIGRLRIPDLDVGQLIVSGIVLGDFDVGKTWEGEVNKSKASPGSRFGDLTTRETIFLGRANFQDVTVSGRKASFPMTVFEGPADFRGAHLEVPADFRFSVFGDGATFKGARLGQVGYFGTTRFRKSTTFTGLYADREVYFDSAAFEGPVQFDDCEWQRHATFENATFAGPAAFTATRIKGRLNMSRATFRDRLDVGEVTFGGMDFFGAALLADARFSDSRFDGKVRFALDDVTRRENADDPTPLLPFYRDYQGDEDADELLATSSSYGVRSIDDLTARITGNLSFANTVFGGFCIFEGVTFGTEGVETRAEFYNTQFLGETHFERTRWYSTADFTTIQASELAMNEAEFHRTLVLDDANIPGRATLTDARFVGPATLSFYGAQIATFQIDRDQVEDPVSGDHRLWYEACATGEAGVADLRVDRLLRGGTATEDEIREICYDRAIDEYVSLKQSFGDRAMTDDEDNAYWWIKHHETFSALRYGGVAGILGFPFRYLVFELAFGWGVRLGNLAVTALIVCAAFSLAYKRWCPDSVMSYNGDNVRIRDIPWAGMFYISLQSLGAFNTGWDFGESDLRFKYLNTAHTFAGVIILTFFVGAYTRMILA